MHLNWVNIWFYIRKCSNGVFFSFLGFVGGGDGGLSTKIIWLFSHKGQRLKATVYTLALTLYLQSVLYGYEVYCVNVGTYIVKCKLLLITEKKNAWEYKNVFKIVCIFMKSI